MGGLVVRKYRWGLAWWVKLLLLVTGIALALGAVLGAYPFLAVTQPVNADVLVVEGWVRKYAIQAAVDEYKSGDYRRVFTTGGPVTGNGGYVNDYQTAASVGADLLSKAGLPGDVLQMVPCHVIGRDRTYSSAIALRDWFHEHNLQIRSLNIVTEGAHARRTRLLFERALGRDVNVGIISVPSPDFDARHWWYYSEGLEEVVQEGVSYLYAKFFFHPREPEAAGRAETSANSSAANLCRSTARPWLELIFCGEPREQLTFANASAFTLVSAT
jgi:uncharacterized SAM-binding protein YcdF (DUF218 family)